MVHKTQGKKNRAEVIGSFFPHIPSHIPPVPWMDSMDDAGAKKHILARITPKECDYILIA